MIELKKRYSLKLFAVDMKSRLRTFNSLRLALSLCVVAMISGCVTSIVTYTQSPEIYGRVIDEAGNPIAGARITLRGEDALQYGYTDDLGEFSLEAIEESRSVILMATSSSRSMLLTVQQGSKKYSHPLVLFYSARGYLAPNEYVLVDEKGIRSFDSIERSL